MKFLLSFTILFSVFLSSDMTSAKDFSGSVDVSIRQRFFEEGRLGRVNGFSEWGALEFGVNFGVYEFDMGLEPFVGFSFIQNSAVLYAEDASGNLILQDGDPVPTNDRLKYQVYTSRMGTRYKPWKFDFFPVIPFGEAALAYRFCRVNKATFAVGQKKSSNGGDLGFDIGGGVLFSFFTNKVRRAEMYAEWGLSDFGLLISSRYMFSGYTHGLGSLKGLGGYDFGGSIFIDW